MPNELEDEVKEIVNEDPQLDEIASETDEEKIDAALELAREEALEAEKTGEPAKDTLPESEETKPSEEKEKETSDDKKPEAEPAKGEFTVSDEFINKQPAEDREILNKYKGKGKEDLAKAAAHAVALKNPYLKDNAEAIDAIAKRIQTGTEEEIVKSLIETQRETGKSPETKPETPVESKIEEPEKLPQIEETPEVKKVIDLEVANRLKVKYPDMPDDPNSPEYKDWLRDKQDDDPRFGSKFVREEEEITGQVKTTLQKVVYLEQNQDKINNQRLEAEVAKIKGDLTSLGITDPEKALGIDLKLVKDSNGLLFNPVLNDLMKNGKELDRNVFGLIGIPGKDGEGLYIMRKDGLSDKFIYKNQMKILSYLANKQNLDSKTEVERLKSENLNTVSTSTPKISKTLTTEDVSKITDDAVLDKILKEAESSA